MDDPVPHRARRFLYVNAVLSATALLLAALSFPQLREWGRSGPGPAVPVIAIGVVYLLLTPMLAIGAFVIGYGLEPREHRINGVLAAIWVIIALLLFTLR
jgi:hypothetical protein